MLSINTLKSLLRLVEASTSYKIGFHWAVTAAVELRAEIAERERPSALTFD